MLVAVIGTLWVVSFIGALAFSTVAYDLIVNPNDDGYRPAYVLTGRRFLTTLFLSLATFYAGLSRNVDKLPPLVEYRLTIQPVTVWPAYVWLILAVALLGMAAISELIGMDWRQGFDFSRVQTALSRNRRTTPAAVAAAIAEQPHPSVDYLLPRDAQQDEHPLSPRTGWNWGQLNGVGTAAAVLLVALLGLFVLNRIGFFGAIGRVAANYSINTILPGDRSTPTPTPIIGEAWAVVAEGDEPTDSRPLALSSDAESENVAAASIPPSTPTLMATLPPASTPEPTPTVTPAALITVNNAAGINARRSPDLSGEVVQVLLPGTSASVVDEERQGDWILVRLPEGSEAWVFADLVALSRPLAGTVPVDGAASVEEAVDKTASETAVEASSVVFGAPADAQASAPNQPQTSTTTLLSSEPDGDSSAAVQVVRSSSFSGAITLIEPDSGVTSSGQTVFRWQAPPTGADRAYEVVVWSEGESPLADGASLGAPTQENQLTVDLGQRSIEAGTRQWGVLLVQTSPYRRLAHLSTGRVIEVGR